MSTLNIPYSYFIQDRKYIPKLYPFVSSPGAMINPQWLELPISKTNFHGPKDVRAIEVRLYLKYLDILKFYRTCTLFGFFYLLRRSNSLMFLGLRVKKTSERSERVFYKQT